METNIDLLFHFIHLTKLASLALPAPASSDMDSFFYILQQLAAFRSVGSEHDISFVQRIIFSSELPDAAARALDGKQSDSCSAYQLAQLDP